MTATERERRALEFVEKGRRLRRRPRTTDPFAQAVGPGSGALERAAAYYSQAIEVEPECLVAWRERALTRFQLANGASPLDDQLRAARHDARKAAALGMDVLGYIELASVLTGEERREFLEEALSLEADDDVLALLKEILRVDASSPDVTGS